MNEPKEEPSQAELEWKEWLNLPQGVLLRRYLKASQQALKDQWAAKQFMGQTKDEIHILNAAALGAHEAYQYILDLTHEQIIEVLEDDHS